MGTSWQEMMLVGERGEERWPYPSARPGTAMRAQRVGGSPVAAEENGGVWGAGTGVRVLGVCGDTTRREEGRGFFPTGVTG